jgi:hypothetical protein
VTPTPTSARRTSAVPTRGSAASSGNGNAPEHEPGPSGDEVLRTPYRPTIRLTSLSPAISRISWIAERAIDACTPEARVVTGGSCPTVRTSRADTTYEADPTKNTALMLVDVRRMAPIAGRRRR